MALGDRVPERSRRSGCYWGLGRTRRGECRRLWSGLVGGGDRDHGCHGRHDAQCLLVQGGCGPRAGVGNHLATGVGGVERRCSDAAFGGNPADHQRGVTDEPLERAYLENVCSSMTCAPSGTSTVRVPHRVVLADPERRASGRSRPANVPAPWDPAQSG